MFSTRTNSSTTNLLLQVFDLTTMANKVFQTIVTWVTLNENTIDYYTDALPF